MQSSKNNKESIISRLLLISPVGLAYGWLPHGAALIKAYVEKRSVYHVDTLSLCVTFSEYVRQNYPELSAFDKEMGEWGSSFHEVYLAAKYFQHVAPEQILSHALQDMCERSDIFQTAPWSIVRPVSEALFQKQLANLIAYCQLVEEYSMQALQDEMASPPFLVGFSCTAQQIFSAVTLAKSIKACYPNIPIIVGGPVITNRNAQRYLEIFPEIDATVLGDGEQVVLEIGNRVHDGENIPALPGVFIRASQTILPIRQRIPAHPPALDEIDAPDFDELQTQIDSGRYPLTTWMARGCSWGKCEFCSIPQFQRSFVHRSADRIYQDLLYLSERYGTSRFRFGDWEVNGDRRVIEELCRLLVSGKKNFEFWGEVNARKMTHEMMKEMKKAGFISVQIGIEGLSDSLLQKMKKPTTVLENVKCLIYAHECGLELFSNLLYNFPGEDNDEIIETQEVIKTIRHLIKPPVTLALTEFLLETDADIIHSLPTTIYQSYTFEKQCFPEDRLDDTLLFLMKHTAAVLAGWGTIQQELKKCYEQVYTFEHSLLNDMVVLRDSRTGEKVETILTGLPARIYRTLVDKVVTISSLNKYFAEVPSAHIENILQDFEVKKYLLRRRNHLLIVSVNSLGESTTDGSNAHSAISVSI